jgi:predicted anti-sigma-YlaC factor YlaD
MAHVGNRTPVCGDWCKVVDAGACQEARDTWSAHVDGEAGALEWRAAERHIENCAACTAWCDAAGSLARRFRVRTADAVPDLTPDVLARVHPTRPGRGDWVRNLLAVVGLTQLIIALPALVMADEGSAPVHTARHLGAMTVALSIGFVYCAWRPERAYGMVPVAAAMAATLVATGVIDVARGATPVLGESTHLLEMAGFVLVWALAGTPGLPRRRGRRWAVATHDSMGEQAA